MNTKTLILSTTTSSYNQVLDTVILNDATVLTVSLGDVYEDVLPISLQINWGDNNILYYDNDLYKVYRQESIIPEVIYGKFSKILQDTYSFEYYPSKTATYKKMTAQFLIKYTNKDTTLITIPIEVRSADYFESVYDMKIISTHILPEDGFKTHKFLTSKGNYIVEVEEPLILNDVRTSVDEFIIIPNVLKNGLIGFWELDETSGTRYDSHYEYDLTNIGGVGYGAGIINNAANFSNNWLVSNTTFDLTSDGFTVSTWLNGNPTNIGPAVSQWQFGAGFFIGISNAEWDSQTPGNYINFVLGDIIPPDNTYNYYSASCLNPGGWNHVVCVYDPNTASIKLYVNGILRSITTDVPSNITLDGTANFKIGTIDAGGEFTYNGLIDSTGLWLRPLSEAEVIALYNNGNGLPYNEFKGGDVFSVGLKAYWKLDEISGTRFDSKNSYNLADNNSVGSDIGILNDSATFNGIDQYLEFNNEIMQFPSQERTITAWVYPNSVDVSVIFGNNNNTPFFLYNNDGVIQLCEFLPDGNLFNGAGNPLNTTVVPLNQWSFVAARYDLSTQEWSAWVNDTKVTISHDFGSVSSRTITRAVIGCNLSEGVNVTNYFDGKIDELAIWDRALSDAEIAQLYNSGNGLSYI